MGEALDHPAVRILHLEDDPNDAELIQATLDADGLPAVVESVSTRQDFVAAIERSEFRLILSDFSLPGFDGISALRIARELVPDVPFIIVSGTLGEEAATESVRNGATDFVLKHRLARLGPSVRRALSEAEERRKRREAEDALRQSEAQLRQTQKMEAIGLLAGGVAHDFNNLLTAILGYGQLIKRRFDPQDPMLDDVEEIVRAAERAAELTRQLLAFSRQQVLEPKLLDLNSVVTNLDKMVRRLIGEDIDVVTAPASDLGSVRADPGQLEQVLMNLVVNARDAMPDGGKLTIETANVFVGQGDTRARVELKPGPYVMMAVSDTGCGMSPETVARIFEPFFTTKEVGRGTGLGLSTVHGIVKQSGGHVEVYSELAHGTTFKVYLPRVEGEAEAPALWGGQMEDLHGNETILLVEDEELIRRVIGKSLRLSGYTVLEAIDGSQAIEVCERQDQPIDLLVTDVVMPLMSGPELARRIATVRPDLPVLFISGYADRALIHQGLRGENTAFLQKPFTPDALVNKVRAVLVDPRQQAA